MKREKQLLMSRRYSLNGLSRWICLKRNKLFTGIEEERGNKAYDEKSNTAAVSLT